MIAFGTAITKPEIYRHYAEPGIRRASEPGSEVIAMPSVGTIFKSYNALLDKAAALDGLEAMVLVHQDAEIVSTDFCAQVRGALADPKVGIVGCVGAIGVRSIAWWEGSVACASFINRYEEHGGGDLASLSWEWEEAPPYARTGEVETLDGFLLAVSPWAVHNVRFDEALGSFHGYDLDYCLQIREAGYKVVTADFRAIHHRPLEMLPDPDDWVDAHVRVADKWSGRMPGIGAGWGDWRERTFRAHAESDSARVIAYEKALEMDARIKELERALAETRDSISWRISAPLRWLAR
jgi:hypothetical protein